jgi:2-keto-4-pentenoate hydratase/2-oxohepta-3-ene-1,7-dioic acid hydratase in catechol pathway
MRYLRFTAVKEILSQGDGKAYRAVSTSWPLVDTAPSLPGNGTIWHYGVLGRDDKDEERVFLVEGDIFSNHQIAPQSYATTKVRILPPCEPTKIVCVGLNYRDHALELKKQLPREPVLFLKPPTSVIGCCDYILYPPCTGDLHYEAELAVVIGKRAKNVAESDSLDYVFGYTAGNDVTARDLQNKDSQWTRAKSFDTFCPLGPWIETDIVDPGNLDITLRLNGDIKQKSNTSNLVFGVRFLVHYISSIMTLLPGDVIMTGTPGGIGPMTVGDEVGVSIEQIGTLRNYVGAG